MPNDKNNDETRNTYMAVWPLDDPTLSVAMIIAEAQNRLPMMLMRDRIELLEKPIFKIQKGNYRSAFGDVADLVVTAEAAARPRT